MNQAQHNPQGLRAFLTTQFLGALNDNAFKLIIGFLMLKHFSGLPQGDFYLSLSGMLFVLPFLLFSTYAGYLADHLSKRSIIIGVKTAELGIVLLAIVGLSLTNIPILLTVIFLMGTHSAFFGPAKYGIIPELVKEGQIPETNGVMVLLTYIGIILGKVLGGYLSHQGLHDWIGIGAILFSISFAGFVSSLWIPPVKLSPSRRPFRLNMVGEIIGNIQGIYKDRPVYLSIVGLTFFAFLSGLFELNILVYAKQMVKVNELQTSFLLIALALGIGLGSYLAGKLSDQKIELGLVPMGAIGISICSIGLGFSYPSFIGVGLNLFVLGNFSGFLIVPLNSLIQKETPADQRGKVIATNNFCSFAGILVGSGILYLLRQVFHLNPAEIFVACGFLTIAGTIYACRILPYALVRLCVWMLAHTIYQIRVFHKERVPATGGALLVANHISFIDAVLIVVCIQRPVRFIMSKEVYQLKWLNPICRLAKAIAIDGQGNPKEIIRALHTAKQALKDGELVCIFPEGQLTRTGNTLKFHQGLEHILKGTDAPIIPIYLDRIWGSIFSWKGGRFFWKWPQIIPYPVTVNFGESLPGETKAFDVRAKILELGAESFEYRKADHLTLGENFHRVARRHLRKFCMTDSSGQHLSYGKALLASVMLCDTFRNRFHVQEKIGVLLPPSVAGALCNIGLTMAGKIPVNINYTASQEAINSIITQCAMQGCITSRTMLAKSGIQLSGEITYIEDIFKSLDWVDKLRAALVALILPVRLSHLLIFRRWSNGDPQSLATIMFTSGSTGDPKGVMLTHANITSNLEGLYQVFEVRKTDRLMGLLPFFHSFGFTGTLWFPLISAMGVIYHYNPLDAKTIGKLVNDNSVSILMSTPTFLTTYLKRIEADQLASLRFVMVGAEKLKPRLAQEFFEKFKVMPMEGYGCTELSPIVSVNMPDYEHPVMTQKAHKPGTIGLALPGIAVKIVDLQTQRSQPPNHEGMLWVKGPNVMKGYLNSPDKTNQVINDGWYQTGDIAMMDEDGFITITDRVNRFSKIAGEMVPHIKVENQIQTILNTSDPQCVVTALPDEQKGERLIVLCLPSVNRAELYEQLRKSSLPNLWIPAKDMYFTIPEFPLLGSGKLDLTALKRFARTALGG